MFDRGKIESSNTPNGHKTNILGFASIRAMFIHLEVFLISL
jgi:hypothetical protein